MMAANVVTPSQEFTFLPLFEDSMNESSPLIISGPCSADTLEKVLDTAQSLHAQGIKYFRAGLWKPRTRPGAFEGVGDRGLPWLRRVKAITGMKVFTEVGNAAHTALAVRGGIDGIWLGARTVANPFAVQEIADELKRLRAFDVAVLIKNPVNPDLALWIGAIERLYNAGIRRIGAIHRGFSSYSPGKWRNPPLWEIPIELHHRLPGLPLLHDPSHCSGNAAEVPALARQAMQLCFSGLMIESHVCPQEALSDAKQQLRPEDVGQLILSLPRHSNDSDVGPLSALRATVDSLDRELLQILASRMSICEKIGKYKVAHGIPIIQPERYASLVNEKIAEGSRLGLDTVFLRKLFSTIHAASVDLQLSLPYPDKK